MTAFIKEAMQGLGKEIKEELQDLRKEMREEITKAIAESVAPLKRFLEQMEGRLKEQESQIREIEKATSDHGDRVVALETGGEAPGRP